MLTLHFKKNYYKILYTDKNETIIGLIELYAYNDIVSYSFKKNYYPIQIYLVK